LGGGQGHRVGSAPGATGEIEGIQGDVATRPRRRTSGPRRRGTGRTHRLVWLLVGILAVYSVFLARGLHAFSQERGAGETFPFFVWELFSRVPKPEQTSYGVRLTAMDGTVLTTPVYYEDSLLPTHQSSPAQAMIAVIGRAYAQGDEERVERYRTIFESRYLQPLEQATYELVWREFDIEERYSCECYTSETVIAEFTLGVP
jgi:hypothetical protein